MKRPLGWVIIYLAAGILLGWLVRVPVAMWLFAGLTLAAICLASNRWRRRLLPALLIVSGGANISLHQEVICPVDLRLLLDGQPQLTTFEGTISRVERQTTLRSDGRTMPRTSVLLGVNRMRKERGSWESTHGQILATTRTDDEATLHGGQKVRIFGVCQYPPGAFASGMFDYRKYLASRGVYFELEFEGAGDVTILRDSAISWPRRFRHWASGILRRRIRDDDPAVGLIWAITLGQRTALTDTIEEPFMRSGTMHLFAVSGLHIGLIAGVMVALLRLVRVPREAVAWVLVPGLWFFTAVTGWPPSAVRATIMMSVVVAGWSLRRPVDLLNSLAAAAFLILLWDPGELFQAGFQLSFAVVASIAVLLPPLEKWRLRLMASDPFLPVELRPHWQRILDGPIRFITMAIAVSVAAWAGSLPLIMRYFHLITPVGLVANVVIVQLGALALASALGSLFCAPFIPLFTDLFNNSAWFFAHLMLASSRWFSGLPLAAFNAKSPPLITTACYYGCMWLIATGVWRRRRWLALTMGLVLVLAGGMAWHQEYSKARLTILPLNGGHALFFDPPGDENWLIDCGDASNWRFRVRPFLQAQGVNRLDNLVLTHGDVRHMGAATNVLDEFSPGRIVLNPLPQRSAAYRDFEHVLSGRSKTVVRPTTGQSLGPWTVLHPELKGMADRADTTSLAMLLRQGGTKVLHFPDLDAAGIAHVIERNPELHPDVLVASPPNGGGFDLDMLEKTLCPRMLVVVDADFPASQRISDATLRRLKMSKRPALCTSRVGAIELHWKPGRLEFLTPEKVRASLPVVNLMRNPVRSSKQKE